MKLAINRQVPVVATGLLLTIILAGVYISGLTLVDDISDRLYDALLRKVHTQPRSGRIVIVDLDDRSLGELGQWPWPRHIVAKLTQGILAGEPAVVAFDIVFAEPDRSSPLAMQRQVKDHLGIEVSFPGVATNLLDYDLTLAEALKGQPVILGCAMRPCEDPVETVPAGIDPLYVGPPLFLKGPRDVSIAGHLEQADDITIPIPVLRRSAHVAFFNAAPDSDNIVRSNPMIWAFGSERLYPAMALEAVRIAEGFAQCVVLYDGNGVQSIRLGEREIPCTRSGRVVVNYRTVAPRGTSGLVSSFPTVPAADVVMGRADPESFRDKLVFVGTSAVGLRDVKATPLTKMFSGVEVHATLADTILAGDVLRRPSYADGMEFSLIILIGLLLTALITTGRSWPSFVVALAGIIVLPAGSLLLLQTSQLVLIPTWSILSVLVIYPTLTTLRYWQEERMRKRVRTMFGTMVSSDVLRYLETNPGSFSLSGERTEASVFFSDVAGFTTISEKLEPEDLSRLLNRYLTPMTQIIMGLGGYVDKYEGDAIMAEWGVPFRVADHPVQACLAAIEQQERLETLRPELAAEFGAVIHVRMGINTGPIVAGNMGSEDRFSYTVMGDTVNLAARLEPANKDYGSNIIIGEPTFAAAAAEIEVRMLDRIVVAGKSKPVMIYELLGRTGALDETQRKLVAHYEAALKLHWERRWDEAVVELEQALVVKDDDRASQGLVDRIRTYRELPPDEDWQGEYVRVAKD